MRRDLIARELEAALRRTLEAPRLRLVVLEGERPATDEAREPWIPIKYGPATPDDWFAWCRRSRAFNRIGMQLLFAAKFPFAYLARINANVERLLDLYE